MLLEGMTILFISILLKTKQNLQTNDFDFVNEIINKYKVNINNNSAFLIAAQKDDYRAVKLMLEELYCQIKKEYMHN